MNVAKARAALGYAVTFFQQMSPLMSYRIPDARQDYRAN
jgi:hypothetical protein